MNLNASERVGMRVGCLVLMRKWSFLFAFLSLGGWGGGASAAECEASVGELPQPMKEGYFRPVQSLSKKLHHLGSFHIKGIYSGTLIQSVAFDENKCQWLAAVSIGRSPELVSVLTFPPAAPFLSFSSSKPSVEFSHPQDLAVSFQDEKTKMWLPDSVRKGVTQFELNDNGDLKIIKNYKLFDLSVNGFFSSVSVDGEYIVTLGEAGDEGSKHQQANIYRLRDVTDSNGESDATVVPLYSWPLNDLQQDRKQWRQGLAVVGNTVFVLSGNAKPGQPKFIVSYKLEGGVIAVDELPSGRSDLLTSGRVITYEPEGLEVVRHKDSLALAFGLAGGKKGNRSYDVWLIPLRR
jgi:hypothetical protein